MARIEIVYSDKTPQADKSLDLVNNVISVLDARSQVTTKFFESIEQIAIKVDGRDIIKRSQGIEFDAEGFLEYWRESRSPMRGAFGEIVGTEEY